jgi:putative component of toxin-antitoxin plasmid stabilization module
MYVDSLYNEERLSGARGFRFYVLRGKLLILILCGEFFGQPRIIPEQG